jgi:hypothetical protein
MRGRRRQYTIARERRREIKGRWTMPTAYLRCAVKRRDGCRGGGVRASLLFDTPRRTPRRARPRPPACRHCCPRRYIRVRRRGGEGGGGGGEFAGEAGHRGEHHRVVLHQRRRRGSGSGSGSGGDRGAGAGAVAGPCRRCGPCRGRRGGGGGGGHELQQLVVRRRGRGWRGRVWWHHRCRRGRRRRGQRGGRGRGGCEVRLGRRLVARRPATVTAAGRGNGRKASHEVGPAPRTGTGTGTGESGHRKRAFAYCCGSYCSVVSSTSNNGDRIAHFKRRNLL